jgi:hypothetical protein
MSSVIAEIASQGSFTVARCSLHHNPNNAGPVRQPWRSIYLKESESMTENKEQAQPRKGWVAPELTVYGNVEDLTLQVKMKQLGSTDDFGINGISDA